MERLVEVLNAQKRHAESEKMTLEILAGRTKVLGPSHPDTQAAQCAIVSILTPLSTQGANIYNRQSQIKE